MSQAAIVQLDDVVCMPSSVALAVKVVLLAGQAEVISTGPVSAPPSWAPPPRTSVPTGQVAVTVFGLVELLADVALTRA